MITMEKAAEFVALMRKVDQDAAHELFSHFDDVFKLNDVQYRNDGGKAITMFAAMCGWGIATGVKKA